MPSCNEPYDEKSVFCVANGEAEIENHMERLPHNFNIT